MEEMEDKGPLEKEAEEKPPVRKGIKGMLDRWRAFRDKVPVAAKAIIAILILVSIGGAGFTAFTTYNFTQNNPKFCNSCHIMNPAFAAWEKSEHAEINCHECHHLSPSELNALMVSAFIKRTEKVPVRYGKIIVPWKYCIGCHWEENEHYPAAKKINDSRLHAKHYFIEKIECAKCHGYKVHEFQPEERYCLECHKGREVHGEGMTGLACLNCHTDRTPDLKPGTGKCLFCHGDDTVRKDLIIGDTIDVKYFEPSDEIIKQAIKIDRPKNAPMQFFCSTCHKPHGQVRPDNDTCLSCHPNEDQVGKHRVHIEDAELQCTHCHKPHSWVVTKKLSKALCSECHEYRDPATFLSGK